ncbi:KDO2-lipid IV(A) lauroyltransferase [Propionibacterium cyclohexanicum]|uniref:KDO2-lipid IV(A) lauroyltransferase n=1 Tax=Propionibacterium cyclohexanicum TaxID=64702 RepID=A0A1H9QMI8_9ACTN|nr:hypothetical protein [Propionibacterium cyclohexanicum]SER61791.1 KDO2-lipid IV(A) lauroyltransferase [Propionibacterium cyclohexanicum]
MKPRKHVLSQLAVMKVGAHTPQWLWRPLGAVVLRWLVAKPPRHVRQWQLNYQVITGAEPGRRATRKAFSSWFENVAVSLQLGHWSPARIRKKVVIEDPEAWARLVGLSREGGLVVALPHMGSWDLVGAYAGLEQLPVTSVAEALPDGQFEYFRDLRAKLGIKIFSVKERNVFGLLRDDVDAGALVCLVADRDFSRRGLPVHWDLPTGRLEQTMPPGPALLAQQGNHPLMAAATWFDGHRKLHVVIAGPIAVGPHEQGLIEASQWLADFFVEQIRAHPLDWHMLQRFFKGVTA